MIGMHLRRRRLLLRHAAHIRGGAVNSRPVRHTDALQLLVTQRVEVIARVPVKRQVGICRSRGPLGGRLLPKTKCLLLGFERRCFLRLGWSSIAAA